MTDPTPKVGKIGKLKIIPLLNIMNETEKVKPIV